jgi:hypothetical protein
MTDTPPLTPATDNDIEQAIAFALRFDGRKRAYSGDEFMARNTAQRLVRHLELSGFVVMKKPPAKAPTTRGGHLA